MSSESRGVVVLPGAGSFGGEFQPLLRGLGPSAWLARYPGRLGRDFGRGAGSFEEVVRACVAQVHRRRPERPVLVGHSFGAYVAHSVAVALEAAGTEVSTLVVVGADAPELVEVPESATRDRSGTAAYLDAVDPGLVSGESSAEWREVVLDTALHDLRLLRDFAPPREAKVRCPVLAVRGEADPLTSDAGLDRWAATTRGGFRRRVLAGGHSDLLGSPGFASLVDEVRAAAPADAPAR
ncbi:thioesterase II family protein [Nocardiopsis sp. FIRDI 009]|uniref:thioesterase II family protein n=1 Tax=Nocardiopsis sp. FIRDI 009 TaxID=714197 RepID=UPI001300878F|nr:alpha/beta fold hydrolase [Nocardiopsis sp. FIRDI 009]